MAETLGLTERDRLPDALRVLLQAFPREAWESHDNFGGMVQFWLQRHAMFRDLSGRLIQETQGYLDGKTEAQAYAARLSRFGGFFLNELHGHHHIEDAHYFPRLVTLEPRIDRGFTILDSDHQEIDALLNAFAEAANQVLTEARGGAAREPAGEFLTRMERFQGLLERHLTDEEDLIVPVILKHGFDG